MLIRMACMPVVSLATTAIVNGLFTNELTAVYLDC